MFKYPTVDEVVRKHVMKVLKAKKHDKKTAAKELGIGLKTLYNWLNTWSSRS